MYKMSNLNIQNGKMQHQNSIIPTKFMVTFKYISRQTKLHFYITDSISQSYTELTISYHKKKM